jgi:hypothetical protein
VWTCAASCTEPLWNVESVRHKTAKPTYHKKQEEHRVYCVFFFSLVAKVTHDPTMGYLIMIPCSEMLLNVKRYLENLHPHSLFVPLPLVTSKSNSTCAQYVTPQIEIGCRKVKS